MGSAPEPASCLAGTTHLVSSLSIGGASFNFRREVQPRGAAQHPGVLPSVIASSYGTACLPERSERGGDDRAEARATGRVRCGPSGAQLIALPRERSRTRLHSTRSEFRTSPGSSLPRPVEGVTRGSGNSSSPNARSATSRIAWNLRYRPRLMVALRRWNKVVWDGGTRFPGNYCALFDGHEIWRG